MHHDGVIKVCTNLIIEHYIKLPLQVQAHNTFLGSKDPTMAGYLGTGVQPSSVEVLVSREQTTKVNIEQMSAGTKIDTTRSACSYKNRNRL
jgi:hypothetical protein